MLRKVLAVILVLAMVLSFSSLTAFAEKKGEAIKGTPVIDGVMEDMWKNAPEYEMDKLIGGDIIPIGKATFRVMWDEEYLYFWADVEDEVMDASNETFYLNDSLAMFLEEDNGKDGTYVDGVDKDNCIIVDGVTHVYYDTNVDNWNAKLVKTEGKGYVVEAAAKFVNIKGEVGKEVGFDITVNDGEYIESLETWDRTGQAFWNDNSDLGWKDTSLLGTIKMVEAPAAGEENDSEDNGSENGTNNESNETDLPDSGFDTTLLYTVAILLLATGLIIVVRKISYTKI